MPSYAIKGDRIKSKTNNKWHDMLSSRLIEDNREIVQQKENSKKHIVDGFDFKTNRGIKFQYSKISTEDIKSRDKVSQIDWIFDVEKQYVRKVKVGNFAICEIPSNNWENAVKVCKNNVFLCTKYKQWLWLKNPKSYHIEVESKRRNVWICKIITFDDLLNMTCLKNIMTDEGKNFYNTRELEIECVKIIYGRCVKSMTFLDGVHRKYIRRYKFKENEKIAIKSVAGSGKTTTLLDLAKIHKKKKILYLAFNKSLIQEIRSKLWTEKIKNMSCYTFDGLMREIFIKKKRITPDITDLRPQTIGRVIFWLQNKSFSVKKYYSNKFIQFCKQINYSKMKDFCLNTLGQEKPILMDMWSKVLTNKFFTFDSIRKIVEVEHLAKNYLDNQYDMIFIDEAQDFDPLMLKMLLDDTTIPKLFVGDSKQAIYEWRGAINTFENLPKDSFIIEFYKTFRIGNPACEFIRSNFDDCWIVPGVNYKTKIYHDCIPQAKYVYLFRSWRRLLTTARETKSIWIHNYDHQIEFIKKLHNKLKKFPLTEEEKAGFADDLPSFLLKLSVNELENLQTDIQTNLVNKEDAECKMYTVHSYKGLEHNIIRICDDVKLEEENIYYVATTRSRKQLIFDISDTDYSESDYSESDYSESEYINKHFAKLKSFS